MSSSILLAMMTAAGSRTAGVAARRDLGARAIAFLPALPAIIAPISTPDHNIVNSIVNNFKRRYRLKKRADSPCRDRAGGNGMKKDRKASVTSKASVSNTAQNQTSPTRK